MTENCAWLSKEDHWYNEAALTQALDEAQIDAIIVRSGQNVTYLSGMRLPGTLARHQDFAWSPRPALVVYPRDGEPTLVVNSFEKKLASQSAWLDDVRTYQGYTESGWKVAVSRLSELGIDGGLIGVERQEITVDTWKLINGELDEGTLIDCTDLLTNVRNIKTERELEMIRESVRIQDHAHLSVFEAAEPCDTERELHAQMLESMVRQGAEWAHGMMQSSNTDITYGGEGPIPIESGDVVRTDYASYFRGYAANLSRMAVMGSASLDQQRKYEDVKEIHRELIDEKLQPGIEAQAVWNALRNKAQDRGYTDVAGLAGHSTGIWWHQEEPILRPGVDTTLKPGMVICLEPILEEYWHIQDQILITENGCERLSDEFPITELYEI